MRRSVVLVVVLVAMAFLLATVVAQAAPSLALATDHKKLAVGESAVLTLNYVVPSADLVGITGALVKYTPPSGLTITGATGPKIIANQASMTWDGLLTPILSNTVYVRIIGQTTTYSAVAGAVTIPVGDLAPGEGDVATVTVTR